MEQKTAVRPRINIAIDGYSACGKSTLAKDLAKKLNYLFVDSGAMYRAATLFADRHGLFDEQRNLNVEAFVEKLGGLNIAFTEDFIEGKRHVMLNGEDVEKDIRNSHIAKRVSAVAGVPELRKKLVALQRAMGQDKGVVMDGRDIGTVVFPDAELKLFVTASIEVRVQRRKLELDAKGQFLSFEELKEDLLERDHKDMTRKTDPLRQADDAIIIDNSDLDKKEQLDLVLQKVNETLQGLELN